MAFKKFLKIWFLVGIVIIVLNLLNLFLFTKIDVTPACPSPEPCAQVIIYLSDTVMGNAIFISIFAHLFVGIVAIIGGFLETIKNKYLKIVMALTVLLAVEYLLLIIY